LCDDDDDDDDQLCGSLEERWTKYHEQAYKVMQSSAITPQYKLAFEGRLGSDCCSVLATVCQSFMMSYQKDTTAIKKIKTI